MTVRPQLNRALGFSPVAVYTTCVLQIEG